MIARDLGNYLDSAEAYITVKDLAVSVGIDVKTIRRILNCEIETDFCNLVTICDFLYKSSDKLIEWCYTLEKPGNIRAAMEYMTVNKRHDDLKAYVYKKALNSGSKMLKRWGNMYLLVLDYENNPYDHIDMLRKVRSAIPGDDEMGILLRLLEANICYRIVCSESTYLYEMSRICDEVADDIYNMKECFLKKTFTLRLQDLICKRELYVKANVEKAREYATKNINQEICALFKANAYYQVGLSFTFESHDQRQRNTEMAIKTYREAGYDCFADDLERWTLPFADAYYGVAVSEGEKEGIAHYEAKWGDKKKAHRLIDEEIEEVGESMYNLYYKGIATNDDNLLLKSLSQFLRVGDNFFAQLPLEQLRKSDSPYVMAAETMYDQFTK
ncbi:AimR family lysis-lysogeny pheromone receptor [Priestia megaterium]|uniref:AimR family lysis-lysogeny pheromone receptor n=1 Tax=Priestia megaterium TaxID=1404 RepID=UPI0039F651DB